MRHRLPARTSAQARRPCGVVYNLFSREDMPDLVCAVPEDRAVPAFLGDAWLYRGRIAEPSRALPGFDMRAAAAGVRLVGYYLLHNLAVRRVRTGEPRIGRRSDCGTRALPERPRAIGAARPQTSGRNGTGGVNTR
ncbi:hypothetical protein [Salinarimonas sp.]|uniref:hypothetical protein n=1 Tax=Salinarimonas sp. TaxID=2766526 RepID=UPI00391D3F91